MRIFFIAVPKKESPHEFQTELNLARRYRQSVEFTGDCNGIAFSIEELVVADRRLEISVIRGIEEFGAKLQLRCLGDETQRKIFVQREIEVQYAGPDEAISTGVAQERAGIWECEALRLEVSGEIAGIHGRCTGTCRDAIRQIDGAGGGQTQCVARDLRGERQTVADLENAAEFPA